MMFGAGLVMTNPTVRRYLGQASVGGVGDLVQMALPDLERYLKLRSCKKHSTRARCPTRYLCNRTADLAVSGTGVCGRTALGARAQSDLCDSWLGRRYEFPRGDFGGSFADHPR